MLKMRDRSRPVLDAVVRHGGLHLILVGTLRVHPQWEEGEPYYGSDSTIAPRDIAAEAQLWMEEIALEQATTERPVSVIRASNVQGVPITGPPGNGLLHKWASEAPIGWVNVPGDGSDFKDFVHVQDLVECIMRVMADPPPTREHRHRLRQGDTTEGFGGNIQPNDRMRGRIWPEPGSGGLRDCGRLRGGDETGFQAHGKLGGDD